MLAGIGENAGVIDIGQGYAVTFKVESHNHPSYVEPYQGAATGVGGIVRDILAMGARPVAVMDPLRFGPLDAADTHRVLPGIVAGVGGYGNCLGLPNIGGEAVFDETYLGNPLVNALCVGVLRHEDLHLAKASGVGNQVILYGARTGGDGIGGVSVLASPRPSTRRRGPAKRPSVQVGDPFMEKLLIECTLEIFAAGLVAGIQDLGGAGLSCATSELASAGDGGMHVELDRVPLRDSTLAPEEILMSESQERMMAVVEPGDVDGVPRDLRQVGRRGRRGRRGHRHRPAPDRLARRARRRRAAAHRSRTTARRTSAPSPARTGRTPCRPTAPRRCRGPRPATSCATTLLRLVAQPEPVRQVLDHRPVRPLRPRQHRARPARPTAAWSASTRRPTSASRSRPTATAASPSSTRTPARSSRWPSPTATSPPAAPRPLAISDCLNFGSPEDPDVMWQFAEACRGLKDACLELGIPVTGGNVSLYNQTGETAILPTPVVAVLGVIEDVTRRTPVGFERRRRAGLPARRDPRGAVRLGVGARRARPPRRAAAAGRPGRREGARRAAARGASACSPAPTTSPTAASARRWSRPRCATTSASRSTLPGRRVRRPVRRVRRPGAGHRGRRRRGPAHRRWPRATAYPLTPLGETGGDALVVDGPVRRPARRAARGLDRHPARRARLTGLVRHRRRLRALPGARPARCRLLLGVWCTLGAATAARTTP